MGLIKSFFKWLKTPDEDEVVNGEININAFKDEDKEVLQELKAQAKKIDQEGISMFKDKAQKRAETVKEIKAKVEIPSLKNKGMKQVEQEREQ